ncbi:MAG TPA: hypothetical protein DIC42_05940 [Holosporales bacterium]|nr:hypothetical protein [Holosporales bacterium]
MSYRTGYTASLKFLHWFMAVVIIGLFVAGFLMTDMAPSELKWTIYGMHKSFGFTMLILVFIRILSRIAHPPKIKDHSISALHYFLIKVSVPVLYLVILSMTLSGFIMSDAGGHTINLFSLYELPLLLTNMKFLAEYAYAVHTYVAPIGASIIGLHILAALYHHFVLKDDTLKRMMPGK